MNFYRPQKRKRAKMGVRESSVVRCPSHLKWVRGHECCIAGRFRSGTPQEPQLVGHTCEGRIEAMHVRCGTNGGTALKPGDEWTIPGCSAAHRYQHQIGEPAFERAYGIDMKAIAIIFWDQSPHGKKYRLQQGERA